MSQGVLASGLWAVKWSGCVVLPVLASANEQHSLNAQTRRRERSDYTFFSDARTAMLPTHAMISIQLKYPIEHAAAAAVGPRF